MSYPMISSNDYPIVDSTIGNYEYFTCRTLKECKIAYTVVERTLLESGGAIVQWNYFDSKEKAKTFIASHLTDYHRFEPQEILNQINNQ